MSQFTVNPHRTDPYKHFKFRVVWDGKPVAGISKVSALKRTTDVVEHREGGSLNITQRAPGLTRFEPITLERGVSHDPEFENWANLVWSPDAGAEVALKSFRKDIAIELFNEAGQLALRYKVRRCWVSEYTALSELGANTSCAAFQQLVLQHEGWERDTEVAEPAER